MRYSLKRKRKLASDGNNDSSSLSVVGVKARASNDSDSDIQVCGVCYTLFFMGSRCGYYGVRRCVSWVHDAGKSWRFLFADNFQYG